MVKAIIFDLDNTLYDYDEPNKYAEEQVGEWLRINKGVPDTKFRETYSMSKKLVKNYTDGQGASHNRLLYFQKMSELLGYRPTEMALEMYDIYWDSFLSKMTAREGMYELLEYLHKCGIKIGICTELTAHIQYRKIRKLHIEKLVDVIVTSEEAGSEKNQDTIFDIIVEKIRVEKESIWYLGDNYERDFMGAKRNNINSFWLCLKKGNAEEINDAFHRNVVFSLVEFKNLIEEGM
jgi:putative hydrolase of the HAD superfamily